MSFLLFEIYLVGYDNDGQNSDFKISFPDELKDYYINYDDQNPTVLKVPNITDSLAKGAQASNTKNLSYSL